MFETVRWILLSSFNKRFRTYPPYRHYYYSFRQVMSGAFNKFGKRLDNLLDWIWDAGSHSVKFHKRIECTTCILFMDILHSFHIWICRSIMHKYLEDLHLLNFNLTQILKTLHLKAQRSIQKKNILILISK